MSKVFDNSGKNTENEIYDTSHRQHWAPTGYAPFKDNLTGFLGIVVAVLLVGLIDIFLLHPIPAPEGTFALYGNSANVYFDLADSGTEYADAKRLSTAAGVFSGEKEVILVEDEGEVHLLMFDYSLLRRLKLEEDLLITETGETQTVRIGSWPFFVDVTIDGYNRITNTDTYGSLIGQLGKLTTTAYVLIGVAVALAGSFVWQKIKNLFK